MHIDEAVPIPTRIRYHFDTWPVGGSRYFDELSEVENCSSAAYSYAKTHNNGFKMTRRKDGNGYRIWRIK